MSANSIVQKAPILAMKNRISLEFQTVCSCYQCLKTFAPGAVIDWTDEGQTAICPHCGVDAVIPGQVGLNDLQEAHRVWLQTKKD